MKQGMDESEALEYFDFNIAGAYMGKKYASYHKQLARHFERRNKFRYCSGFFTIFLLVNFITFSVTT